MNRSHLWYERPSRLERWLERSSVVVTVLVLLALGSVLLGLTAHIWGPWLDELWTDTQRCEVAERHFAVLLEMRGER